MADSPVSATSGTANNETQQCSDRDLEIWKHFAAMGGNDKNTMITTVSWLLAFSATAIGFLVTDPQMIASSAPRLPHPHRMMVVSLLGVLVSTLAGYLALLYGGYSNRNWAKADRIARRHGWVDLLPEGPDQMIPERGDKPGWFAEFAWKRARPCLPQTYLAPVFKVFSALAIVAGIVHASLFVWSSLSRFFPCAF
jgi:hypothetical protein